MKNSKMSLMVQDIRPDAKYHGQTYTQLVKVSVRAECFIVLDSDLLISEEHVGQKLELELATFALSPNRMQLGTKKEIKVNQSLEVVELFGAVLDMNIAREVFLLDVGIGTILCDGIDINTQDKGFQVNLEDYVVHNPRRIDLIGIY